MTVHVGIDGGASSTRARLVGGNGDARSAVVGKPSSLTLGVDEAWAHILEALDAVGVGPEASADVRLACALAGSRRSANRVAFFAAAPGFAALTLCSDGHAMVLGAHAGQPGAAVAIGTGIVGNCVAEDGTARQVGGWGFPVRDEASGAWLGRLVLAEALRLLDGYDLEATPLHHAVLATVGPGLDAMADWTYQAPSTRYATLAPLVVDAADAGDRAGLRLMRRAAEEAERLVDALDPARKLPLCFGGSLAAPILGHMAARVVERVRPSLGDACDGAVLLARGLARSDLPT